MLPDHPLEDGVFHPGSLSGGASSSAKTAHNTQARLLAAARFRAYRTPLALQIL